MKVVNNEGITNSVASIKINVCEKQGFYLDLLEDGKWLVSKQDKKIGLFTDAEECLFFFISKTSPTPKLTEQEENEAWEYLESFIR